MEYLSNQFVLGFWFASDVDECEDPELNDCTDRCTNTIGGYNCSCPWGHHGHGRGKDGCTADQLLFIKITIGTYVYRL